MSRVRRRIGRSGSPRLRRRLVAARRRLPGLPAQLRRQRRRRRRRPAGHHRPPRPPRPGRPRRRRDLAVADLPLARARRRLRRQRPRSASIRVFGTRGRLRPARRGGPPARASGSILDLVMNHTSDQHPWFEASRASRDRPVRRLVPVARPGRLRAPTARRCRPNNWVSFFGGPAWTWEPRRGPVLPPHVPGRAARPELAQRRRVEAAQFAMVRGWLDRGVDGFRLDVFNVFLKHPDLPSNPRRGAARPPGPARSTATTATSPTSPALLGALPGDRRRGRPGG